MTNTAQIREEFTSWVSPSHRHLVRSWSDAAVRRAHENVSRTLGPKRAEQRVSEHVATADVTAAVTAAMPPRQRMGPAEAKVRLMDEARRLQSGYGNAGMSLQHAYLEVCDRLPDVVEDAGVDVKALLRQWNLDVGQRRAVRGLA